MNKGSLLIILIIDVNANQLRILGGSVNPCSSRGVREVDCRQARLVASVAAANRHRTLSLSSTSPRVHKHAHLDSIACGRVAFASSTPLFRCCSSPPFLRPPTFSRPHLVS